MPKPRSSQVSLIDTPITIASHVALDVPFYVVLTNIQVRVTSTDGRG
jgi:hypothetical protein